MRKLQQEDVKNSDDNKIEEEENLCEYNSISSTAFCIINEIFMLIIYGSNNCSQI